MCIHAYKKLAGLSELGRPILLFIPVSPGWSIAGQRTDIHNFCAYASGEYSRMRDRDPLLPRPLRISAFAEGWSAKGLLAFSHDNL